MWKCLTPILGALLLNSCAVSSFDPSTGEVRTTPASSSLVAKGAEQFQLIKRKKQISRNSAYNAQVQRVAARLKPVIDIPNANWEFVVFEDDTPNAFALPGGKVGVHTGLFQITRNDAGLAAVLGHEIAHVVLNHSQERVNQAAGLAIGTIVLDQVLRSGGASDRSRATAATGAAAAGTLGMVLPHSRRSELEADKLGTIYMARAGYDPEEAVDLWQRFAAWRQREKQGQAPEFLRTHPLDSSRIRALREFLPVAQKQYRAP
ncbi:MAG: M48 family metallopeptidase [Akkermansiaceae bacterium]|nr:M48 family metallopeptidase [Akkermansiaceae bacterium]